ncbi:MAG: pyruvate:ferredoxin (flavodoxin) oxidoreductase [Pseudoflavonifractor sp.]|nr:pyruvate:ferredoxin (flavodoxin) oxidoreductase [Alloprevotella sp.]MCM1117363.1 pyruvate:ferredoxin (flavodoxin) oxidoreductase [Pseudoflavonifractor sp.]
MKQIMDGCTAATHVAYALSDIATIYPITPVASMGSTADKWALHGRLNIFGNTMEVKEMESELGAAGATHGALAAGALATTFTASQGLLLMIPNMYKIAGEMLPAVFHVGSRSIAAQALSIFGDHQDVMACRATGFTMLASASVQEAMDLALVAHLAAIDGSLPVLHFMDGWRTSNEMATIDVLSYDDMASLVDMDKVKAFRAKGMNPMTPDLRGSAQNPDVYFQTREAANRFYDAFPQAVQTAMDRVAKLTGRQYHLFDYTGAPDATEVIVTMGSSAKVAEAAVESLAKAGRKVGVVSVHMFNPFSADHLLAALPATVKTIAVLDRTKEPGSQGEPLLLNALAAVQESGRAIRVIGGRYGLSSKEFDPAMAIAVYDETAKEEPKRRFTVGIIDDVTHLSLTPGPAPASVIPDDVKQCVFYGMGSDGTVGATRQAAAVLTSVAPLWAQAYFEYSAKKSDGYTISQLRLAPHPIEAAYSIEEADYIGCNKDIYIHKFPLADNLKEGGIFVLNTPLSPSELAKVMPQPLAMKLKERKARVYIIDAGMVAAANNLGVRVNMIMETIFLKLIGSVNLDSAITALKEKVSETYMHEGGDVVKNNIAAIDAAPAHLIEVDVNSLMGALPSQPKGPRPEFVAKIADPCNRRQGNALPVSLFSPDGTMPMGTTAYEKRGIAVNVPQWDPDKCVECCECSLVCSHASIRPWLLTPEEKAKAPAGLATKGSHIPGHSDLQFRIQIYPLDCVGCGSCAEVCPGKALTMVPLASQLPLQEELMEWCRANVMEKDTLMSPTTVAGTQLQRPLMEFSGACGGCGETPYVKLLTQLFGPRMVVANATGCSSIWSADYPSNAYCTDRHGHGPAWGNSLFEDNAEYGFGIATAIAHRRRALLEKGKTLLADPSLPPEVKTALQGWVDSYTDGQRSQAAADALLQALKASPVSAAQPLIDDASLLGKKSVWAIGGDGWAYDIGFAGLDHVLAQDIDINLLVMDTECYSNTGGQMSKATPISAVVKYAAAGKRTFRKDLGRMMMTYGNIYVAQVSLGGSFQQTIEALTEADSYPGPAIVIAYCPCINHGIRAGMGHAILEEREATRSGYWPIYRYDPRRRAKGMEPLQLDTPQPDGQIIPFINGEDRYADLKMVSPKEAPVLQHKLATRAAAIYSILKRGASGPGPSAR